MEWINWGPESMMTCYQNVLNWKNNILWCFTLKYFQYNVHIQLNTNHMLTDSDIGFVQLMFDIYDPLMKIKMIVITGLEVKKKKPLRDSH